MRPLKIIFSVLVATENMITENVIKRAQKVLWQRRDSGGYRLNLRAVLLITQEKKKITRDIIVRYYVPLASLRTWLRCFGQRHFRHSSDSCRKNSMNQNSANGFALLVDPRIRVHPKRCARIRASKDRGCDYMKGVGKRAAGGWRTG